MRADNTKRFGKPVHQQIIFPLNPLVEIHWVHGKFNEPPFLAYHRELEFHYIKRGEDSYFIGNQKYQIQKNSILVIRPNEIHCEILQPDSYIEKAHLIFDPSLIKDERWLTRFPRKFPRLLLLSEKETTRVEIILNEIVEEEKKERYWQEIILLKLKEFLLLVKRVSVQNPPPQQPNPRISRILTYVEEKFTQKLTCDSIADEFALAPGYLSPLFKKHTGMNLKRYILQRRIVEAKRLLVEQPNLKVGLIPRKVGFSDFALFNRSFKLITGLTPSAYRKISH
jgi:AraC family transcriptional regulator of arabinose operon